MLTLNTDFVIALASQTMNTQTKVSHQFKFSINLKDCNRFYLSHSDLFIPKVTILFGLRTTTFVKDVESSFFFRGERILDI